MVVGAAIINDMSHVLPASGLQRRPSLRARLLGQPTVVDVICERESRLGGSLICPFDLDAVGSAITLKVPESTSPGADMFAFGSGIHEPLTSRLTRSVALVAHETGAYDDEAASRGRETLEDAHQVADGDHPEPAVCSAAAGRVLSTRSPLVVTPSRPPRSGSASRLGMSCTRARSAIALCCAGRRYRRTDPRAPVASGSVAGGLCRSPGVA